MALVFSDVSFGYDSASGLLFSGLSFHLESGWTGLIGPNGSGKSTLLALASGQLAPLSGHISSKGHVVYCPQLVETLPGGLTGLLQTPSREARRLCELLALGTDWPERWQVLSPGEQKRAQLATALFSRPDVLLVDEPTNHLDAEARDYVGRALADFKGVGLLVAHDRTLLDALCANCLMLEEDGVHLRAGNYSQASAQARADRERAQDERQAAKREVSHLASTVEERLQRATKQDSKRSKRKLSWKDSDAREKIDRAVVSGADGSAGRSASQLAGRLAQAQGRLAAKRVVKAARLRFTLPSEVARRDLLVEIGPGELPMGPVRKLRFPSLAQGPRDRVALVGPNGAGKSTLLGYLLGQLRLPEGKLAYIPQELPSEDCARLVEEVRKLPHEQLGQVMTILAGLGSEAERVLESAQASPGEARKLLLALQSSRLPQLIVLDEPTNHLDLPAIELLEEALAGTECALLLVSHDSRFIERLTSTCWSFMPDTEGDTLVQKANLPPTG